MKNLSLALNIVLLVAVSFLFYKQFSGPATASSNVVAGDGQERIAYINIDTLYQYYKFYTDSKAELEKQGQKATVDLQNRLGAFEKKRSNYVQMAQAGLLSNNQIKEREDQLMREGQEVEQYRMSVQQGLAAMEQEKIEDLYKRISAYLEKYNKEKGFTYIFGYQPGGMIWHTGSPHDITMEIVEAMNKEYETEAANKPKE